MELLLPKLGLIVWTIIAFLIVFLILKKFAWKPILKSLNDREKNISDSILSAEKVRAEMALLKRENEALLVKAREERAMMLKEAKEQKDKNINGAKTTAKLENKKKIENPLTDIILERDCVEKIHVDVVEEEIVVTKV